MSSTPISEVGLWDLMNEAWERMPFPQDRLWEAIGIDPEKWTHAHYRQEQGGFWVVGLIGRTAIWYNDWEDGLERSNFVRYGEFVEFGSNEHRLEDAMQHDLNQIELGYRTEPRSSGPFPCVLVRK